MRLRRWLMLFRLVAGLTYVYMPGTLSVSHVRARAHLLSSRTARSASAIRRTSGLVCTAASAEHRTPDGTSGPVSRRSDPNAGADRVAS